MYTIAFITTIIGVCLAQHGMDTTVCTIPQPDMATHQRPVIVNDFEVHVECDITNKNLTTDIHEFFDSTNNRGMVRQHLNGIEYFAYYDYSTNEYLGILPQQKLCEVSDLAKSSQRFLFGYKSVGAGGHMFSASGAFHFGGDNIEVYKGTVKIRGILTERWYSCQYWKDMDSTMTVDWYFTAQNEWDSAAGFPQAPVRAHVKGRRWQGTKSHTFDHTYEFFHFRPQIRDPRVFETPSGVSCAGRKNTKPLPKVPDGFSFTSEVVNLQQKTVSYMKEHFDGALKYVRYTYRTPAIYPNRFGHNELMEIHDFNTGVAYVIDREIGNCTAIAIEKADFDLKTDATYHTVRIRTAKEFFDMNRGIMYTYEGVKTIRQVDCDTWVSKTTKFFPGTNSTLEWYYATSAWNETGPAVYKDPIPIQMRITIPSLSYNIQSNIYNFVRERPDLLHDDVSACYEFRNRRIFRFRVSGQYRAQVDANRKVFKYFVLATITAKTGISPIRVSKLTLMFAQDIVISFEMLDVAPPIGDISNPAKEVSLVAAANTLTQLIKNRQFVIEMNLPTFKSAIFLVAKPDSIQEIKYVKQQAYSSTQTTGYTGGIMAAVALPLGIVGGALGVVLTYIFFK